MKKTLGWLIVALVLASGSWWGWQRLQEGAGMGGPYAAFAGNTPGLQVMFEYPTAWGQKQEAGKVEKFQQVRLMGPRNARNTYTCSLSLRASAVAQTADQAAGHYLGHLFGAPHVVSDQPRQIAGVIGREVVVAYTMPALPHHGFATGETQVKTLTCFFQQAPYLYALTYSADAEDFERYRPALERLIRTLQLRQ